MMKLWILEPLDDAEQPWHGGYDMMFGAIVRAETEKEARMFAVEYQGDEAQRPDRVWEPKSSPWLDPEMTSCRELTPDGEIGLVLQDYRAG